MKSMTGYGKGTASQGGIEITIELKTVNSRFLDVNLRLGKSFLFLEDSLRTLTASQIKRGTVDIFFNCVFLDGASKKLVADIPMINEYAALASAVSKQTGIANNLSFSDLLGLDLIKAEGAPDSELLKELSAKALRNAINNLDEMRMAEGTALKTDLTNLLLAFKELLEAAEKRAPIVAEEYRVRLKQRMEEIASAGVDEMRLLTEAAIFADKSDINEEIKRLYSHISQLKDTLESPEPQGRRLEFLLQEMGRETNTMGSKSSDIALSKLVIGMKDILEKLREQARNAE